MEYDFGIIGGGPAGYTAAMMLAKNGKSVILFEKDKLGGTCLNRGCIPTKSFIHFSDLYAQIKCAKDAGIDYDNLSPDFSKIIQKKDEIVGKLRKSLELAVKNSGVKVIYATACIKDKNTISADGSEYKVAQIIAATGAKPREIKGLEFDGKFILSSDDILNIKTLPKSALIVGSGAIGIEWARILRNFDVEVSVVEMAEHLTPGADIEVSKRIERIFKLNKIPFYLNDSVKNIENETVTLMSGTTIKPEIILVAAGRVPQPPACDCAKILGDACGEIQLAHYAIGQAKEFATGIPYNKTLIPSVIYGEPEIAWVGLREQDMDETCKKVMLPITALGKAWCDSATDGFIKLVLKDNKIAGAHIISKEASSLIHILLTAIQNNIEISELKKMCFAHPTYAEGIFDLIINL